MTRKLKNHFGVEEDLTQAINYVQNKVRLEGHDCVYGVQGGWGGGEGCS